MARGQIDTPTRKLDPSRLTVGSGRPRSPPSLPYWRAWFTESSRQVAPPGPSNPPTRPPRPGTLLRGTPAPTPFFPSPSPRELSYPAPPPPSPACPQP